MRRDIIAKTLILICLISSSAFAAIRHTPGPDYPKIQDAINASATGDTVVILPGTHIINSASLGLSTTLYVTKNITIQSLNPYDPCTVAGTVLQGGFSIGYDVLTGITNRADPTINGLTIEGRYRAYNDGCNGGNTAAPCDMNFPIEFFPQNPWKKGDPNGQNGWSIDGGGMHLYVNSSPKVTNCVFSNCSIEGRNGGDGGGSAGWGGWAGWAYGGAVFVGPNGTPVFKNCDFIDCVAVGGDGGNAAKGRGGSWGSSNEPQGNPLLWPFPGGGWLWAPNGGYREIWRYSGLGGAVYCDEHSTPSFDNCNFVNNRAMGGSCGISDTTVASWPQQHWKIPRYGGAIFCAADSVPDFNNCNFIGNEPDPNNGGSAHKNGAGVADNPYIGFGGAVAYEDGSTPKFRDCAFNGNRADAGGATYDDSAAGLFSGCTFINNTALVGGGVFMIDSGDIISNSQITGNTATIAGSGGGGIYVFGGTAQIVDSMINNNTASSGGGVYVDSGVTTLLRNCLITGNSASSEGAGVNTSWGSNTSITNCTIAGNTIAGSNGYGGGIRVSYTGTVAILNSILWSNTAAHGNQLAIGASGLPATANVNYSDVQGGASGVYFDTGVSGSNLVWDYTHNLTGLSTTDPNFVSGYYLSQPPKQGIVSPCVDKGNLPADDHSLHMYRHTTSTNNKLDAGTVDMGYHYVRIADIAEDYDINGDVNGNDYALFTNWPEHSSCSFPYWCDGRDLNQDGTIDEKDLRLFTGNWLGNETTPPSPDPMTWAAVPYYVSTPTRKVIMTATSAFDNSSGHNVEYYFQRTTAIGDLDGTFRDWDSNSTYQDTTVAADTTYGYMVQARDKSGNTTQPSTIAFVNTVALSAPTPATQTWASSLLALSSTQIQMVATTATAGTAGVQYYFDCISGAGHDSGWQDSATYIDSNLAPTTSYSYKVRARNKIDTSLMNAWSITGTTTTNSTSGPDVNAPTPNPMTWATAPHSISQSSVTMVASTATDVSGVEYYFDSISAGGHDSGWITSRTYTDTGLTGTSYSYQVRARDGSAAHNMTGWSIVRTATIDRSPPSPNPLGWTSLPAQSGGPFGNPYIHTMTCTAATDATGPVLYKFICVSNGSASSGWQTSTTYTVNVGSAGPYHYTWEVEAKDGLGNTTNPDPTAFMIP